MYKGCEILKSKNKFSLQYRYSYAKASRVIIVVCKRAIDGYDLKYVIKLRDTAKIFNKNSFSVDENYQYLESYFEINNSRLPLKYLHSENDKSESLTPVSNLWEISGSEPKIKHYILKNRDIFVVKGTNPFCNGHSCSDYVVYILQIQNGKASVHSLYFSGKSGSYDFDHTYLFYKSPNPTSPLIMYLNMTIL